MKYSEFETIAKENGWEIDTNEAPSGWVDISKDGFGIDISKSEQNRIILYTRNISTINLYEEKEFIDACYALAETPIEDREDEKYYTIELPFSTWDNQKISLNSRSRDDLYWSDLLSDYFTEKQIKEIDPRLWEFAVEVE